MPLSGWGKRQEGRGEGWPGGEGSRGERKAQAVVPMAVVVDESREESGEVMEKMTIALRVTARERGQVSRRVESW